MTDKEAYIKDLENRIQILEFENEILSAKAQQSRLLHKAFEAIYEFTDSGEFINDVLEKTALLSDIDFAGLFDFENSVGICRNFYAAFSNTDINPRLQLSPQAHKTLDQLDGSAACFRLDEIGLIFSSEDKSFEAFHGSIVPSPVKNADNQYFIFLNQKTNPSLSGKENLLSGIVKIAVSKLETLYYQDRLRKMNQELEKFAENRTRDLKEQIADYMALNKEYKKVNEELHEAKERAEESSMLKTAFLNNLSHEIRTPLNGIIGFSSLLLKNGVESDKTRDFLKIIISSSNKLLEIVNDILAISFIETKQEQYKEAPFNINTMTDELSFLADAKTQDSNIEIVKNKQLDDDEAEFITDGRKIKSILTYLINNAVKFTEEGSIEMGYFTDFKKQQNILVFYVEDTGIGIRPEHQKVIFEPFRQADQSISFQYGGTGLGLAIAAGLAEMLKGKIWVESDYGQGATFYLSIPGKSGSQKYAQQKSETRLETPLILIVDDEPANVQYLQELLQIMNLKSMPAYSGEEAVQICRKKSKPDLILMDIKMPGIDGYEAARSIRKIHVDIPIIAQTAYADEKFSDKAPDLFNHYLIKPISPDDLEKALSNYIENVKF